MAPINSKRPKAPITRQSKVWLEIYAKVPFEYVEPVANLFHRHGKGGVVIEEAGGYNPDEGESPPVPTVATLRTYMPTTQYYRRSRELVNIGLALIAQLADETTYGEHEITEKEWEEGWAAHFKPLRVGNHIVVRPPWGQKAGTNEDVIVKIDPGLAFGTGHHPTTRMTLECLERLLMPGSRVLDVGAGSGILSIAAAKLGASKVTGVETDSVAIRSARANLRANGVTRTVRLYHGSLPQERISPGEADLALANISAKTLIELAPLLRIALRKGGRLVASGLLTERKGDVRAAFGSAKLTVDEEHVDGDWVALVSTAD